jgi:hypothetical protein
MSAHPLHQTYEPPTHTRCKYMGASQLAGHAFDEARSISATNKKCWATHGGGLSAVVVPRPRPAPTDVGPCQNTLPVYLPDATPGCLRKLGAVGGRGRGRDGTGGGGSGCHKYTVQSFTKWWGIDGD